MWVVVSWALATASPGRDFCAAPFPVLLPCGTLGSMRNRVKLAALLWTGLMVAGCGLTERQRTLLLDGERAFRDRRYPLAVEQLTAFLGEAESRPEAARALYVRGMALALSEQRTRAYADLQHAAADRRDPQIASRARGMLGVLHFEDGHWEEAAREIASATSALPSEPPVDALLFRLGVCRERLGQWGNVQPSYRRIVTEFPSGPYGALASRRLELNADHYSVQCGVFSRPNGASALVEKLRTSGFSASVRREARSGAVQHVVVVGRYATYAEAINALARVKGIVPEAVLWP